VRSKKCAKNKDFSFAHHKAIRNITDTLQKISNETNQNTGPKQYRNTWSWMWFKISATPSNYTRQTSFGKEVWGPNIYLRRGGRHSTTWWEVLLYYNNTILYPLTQDILNIKCIPFYCNIPSGTEKHRNEN
jgi:hypothetical protein